MPDPEAQFTVEEDTLDVGDKAVLSKRWGDNQKLHPCAYFLHRLTLQERNYGIGDPEFLTIKLALQEKGHWFKVKILKPGTLS